MTPRVLVDATAVPADRRGVGRYVDSLLAALDTLDVDLAIACQRVDVEHYGGLAPGARLLPGPRAIGARPARLAWEQTGLARAAAKARVDLVHSPHYTMPVAPGRPVVVTLHDATFFTDPRVHSALKGRFFRAATRHALRRARRCVVPSRATRDELVRVAGADGSRIDVAHHGVDAKRFRVPDAGEVERVRRRLGLTGRYVAFLGTLEPRKNVPELIRGWVSACRDTADPPALVLAGGQGWDHGIDAAVAAVPPGLALLRPGYLPVEDLAGLLGGADVVAYPSLGEGFGLPVLEAMACGAAVLTTRRLALPEVGGDAVAYSEPDAGALAEALRDLLADPGRRAELGRAGRRRAEQLTWTACAQAHLEAYRRALSPP